MTPPRPEWRPVPGHPAYEVSSTGRVRRVGAGRRYLRPQPCGRTGAYLKVNLGRGVQVLVHRVVCEAFHGPPPTPAHHADHLDYNPRHNAADNRRWLAASLNIGRQLRRVGGEWRYVAEEDPPEGFTPLTDAELDELDEQLDNAAGW